MDTVLEKVIQAAATEFNTGAAPLSAASTPEDVTGWDSEAQLRLAMALEEEFGISFGIEEFESIRSLGGLAELIARKRNPVGT